MVLLLQLQLVQGNSCITQHAFVKKQVQNMPPHQHSLNIEINIAVSNNRPHPYKEPKFE